MERQRISLLCIHRVRVSAVQYSESLAGIPNGIPADVENKKALNNQGFNGN